MDKAIKIILAILFFLCLADMPLFDFTNFFTFSCAIWAICVVAKQRCSSAIIAIN